ncbi:DUF262 domain-containing protein [Amycolatopsis sp. cmx-4-83]|uniref:DUF262 domain-containing protein n=1 Tax=Amycolatopsis sp. cmx-4-83 TaxID=2790940 RepID=UPI00397BBD44
MATGPPGTKASIDDICHISLTAELLDSRTTTRTDTPSTRRPAVVYSEPIKGNIDRAVRSIGEGLFPPANAPSHGGSGEGRDEVEDFWNDLEQAVAEKSDEAYFLGTVILSDSSDYAESITSAGRSFIIDGQQRLTTAFLLIFAIRDIFNERNDSRGKDN